MTSIFLQGGAPWSSIGPAEGRAVFDKQAELASLPASIAVAVFDDRTPRATRGRCRTRHGAEGGLAGAPLQHGSAVGFARIDVPTAFPQHIETDVTERLPIGRIVGNQHQRTHHCQSVSIGNKHAALPLTQQQRQTPRQQPMRRLQFQHHREMICARHRQQWPGRMRRRTHRM